MYFLFLYKLFFLKAITPFLSSPAFWCIFHHIMLNIVYFNLLQTHLRETEADIQQMIHTRLRKMEQIKNSVDVSKVSLA